MVYDENSADRIRGLLAKRRNVVEKRMIGGLCFVLDGSMCCGVNKDGLLLRVGPDDREHTLKLRHVKPMKFGGRQLKGFVVVEPSGFRTDAAMAKWVAQGVEYAKTMPVNGKSSLAGKRSR